MNKQPKYKICRRLGSGIYEKCQTQKFALSETKKNAQKSRRRRSSTDYGKQLLEKQKVRFTYGIKEKQLIKYVKEAMMKKGLNIYDKLFESLELRLDNVVYRLGLAESRAKARQMVSHGHILVNGKKLNIPSYKVCSGNKIGLRQQSLDNALFKNLEEKIAGRTIPSWLMFDVKKKEGKMVSTPKMEKISNFDLQAVFEFYSR